MTIECKPNTRHIIWPVHDAEATYRNWALRVRDWIDWIYDADDRQESQEHLDMLPYWWCNEVREECDYTADPAVFMQFRIVKFGIIDDSDMLMLPQFSASALRTVTFEAVRFQGLNLLPVDDHWKLSAIVERPLDRDQQHLIESLNHAILDCEMRRT